MLRSELIDSEQFYNTVHSAWTKDNQLNVMGLNYEGTLDDKVNKEVGILNQSSDCFKLYGIYDGTDYLGYFGIDSKPSPWLSTFFIEPEFRNNKKEIWKFIVSHLPKDFKSSLYECNVRAIQFFKNQGALELVRVPYDNTVLVIFSFKE